MKSTAKRHCFAEIVESSLTNWTAQSWKWDSFPEFGALVVVPEKKRNLFGIVHQINTGSLEPGRYPFTYQKTQEELQREQPQIFEFLKTTFSCITLGYQEHEKIFHSIAPEPPKIHSFVGPLSGQEYKQFFVSPTFMHLIFSSSNIENIDEILIAVITHLKKQEILNAEKLSELIDTYTLLIGNDYRRLKLFLGRIQNLSI
jgi:hypothetical protein